MIELRESIRRRTFLGGRIVVPFQRSETECLVRDLSAGGARIEASRTILLPNRFDLVIPWREEGHRAELVWRRGDLIGLRFLGSSSGLPDLDPDVTPTLH